MANLNFALGALACGMWFTLIFYWAKNSHGVVRLLLCWIAINTFGSLAIRLVTQVQHYEAESFPAIDWFRFFFNISVLCLGVFLAKRARRISIMGENV